MALTPGPGGAGELLTAGSQISSELFSRNIISRPTVSTMGRGGIAEYPQPGEAGLVENMHLLRDGTWAARTGFNALAAPPFTPTSNVMTRAYKNDGLFLPSSNYLLLADSNGDLRNFNTSGGTTIYGTQTGNWTETWYPYTHGGDTAADVYTILPLLDGSGGKGALYKVDKAGNLNAIGGGSPDALWVEKYGNYTMAVDESAVYWSNVDNSDTWTGTDNLLPTRDIADLRAIVTTGHNNAYLMGTQGVALFYGSTGSNFGTRPLFDLPVFWSHLITRIPYGVIFWSTGNRIYRLMQGGKPERIDTPLSYTIGQEKGSSFRAWYDRWFNAYVLSDQDNNRTYFFSLDAGVWTHVYTVGLMGYGEVYNPTLSVGVGDGPLQRIWVYNRSGTCQILDFPKASYTDDVTSDNAAYVCTYTTPPRVAPGYALFGLQEIFVDGGGTWEADVQYRLGPEESWTSLDQTVTIVAPGRVNIEAHQGREGRVVLTATAAQGVLIRDIQLTDRVQQL